MRVYTDHQIIAARQPSAPGANPMLISASGIAFTHVEIEAACTLGKGRQIPGDDLTVLIL
jgi:hypothetical protein